MWCEDRKNPRVLKVFVTFQTAIDGLPQQVGEGKLRILPTAGVRQVLFDEFSEPVSLVQFPRQNQAAVGGDEGALEIDPERGVGGELKGMISCLTQ